MAAGVDLSQDAASASWSEARGGFQPQDPREGGQVRSGDQERQALNEPI